MKIQDKLIDQMVAVKNRSSSSPSYPGLEPAVAGL